jgi:hypothetical protein
VPPVKLDSELVRTRIAITHQLLCSGVKILLSTPDTLFERSRRALVENLQAATLALRLPQCGTARDFHPCRQGTLEVP